eukprot:10271012-Ditylum_brightwellii.AAC.1
MSLQTPTPEQVNKISMKICRVLIDILIKLCPGVYNDCIVLDGKNKQKVIYMKMLMALYGMLVSSMLFYKTFFKDLETQGFRVNPYSICVVNRNVKGKQHTMAWHMDNIKSSHQDANINEDFYKWCKSTYRSEKNGHVKRDASKQI